MKTYAHVDSTPMAYHKFLICLGFPLSLIYSGFSLISWHSTLNDIPQLRAFMVFLDISSAILAALLIAAWIGLGSKSKYGIYLLGSYYIAWLLVYLFQYSYLAESLDRISSFPASNFDATIIAGLIQIAIKITILFIYYGKRRLYFGIGTRQELDSYHEFKPKRTVPLRTITMADYEAGYKSWYDDLYLPVPSADEPIIPTDPSEPPEPPQPEPTPPAQELPPPAISAENPKARVPVSVRRNVTPASTLPDPTAEPATPVTPLLDSEDKLAQGLRAQYAESKQLRRARTALIITASVLFIACVILSLFLYASYEENDSLFHYVTILLDEQDAIQKELTAAQKTSIEHQRRASALKGELESLQADYDFAEEYAIKYFDISAIIGFVVSGSSKYHTYECNVFTSAKEYWAHNVEYCKYLGYSPHTCWD